MKLSYYGHSTFLLEIKGLNLLFDPFITPNELAKDIDVNSIPADYILVSHGHEDHVADAVSIAKRTGATVVSNFEIVSWFEVQGVEKGHPMNHGGSWSFDFGSVKYVNAVHSSVLPDGTYGGNPGGFIISADEGNVYYAGDTALTYDMKLIGDTANISHAILPIGNNFTMGVDDAVRAAEFVGCKEIIGMHYDTFGYIEIDKEEAKGKFSTAGKTLTLLNIGETIDL
jgi:L-ascorbate metabolism protein UlaG (beta-lactamase superfamily)